MTISDKEKLEVIRKKVDQLDKLYDEASRRQPNGQPTNTNDILLLLRFTLSLERQIRQLQADFKELRNVKVVA